jgi:hypothetical protein
VQYSRPVNERDSKSFGFQNDKSDLYEWLLRMPTVGSAIHSNKEQSFELFFDSPLIQMQARNLSPHCFTSTG